MWVILHTKNVSFHKSEHFISEIMAAALCALFHTQNKKLSAKEKARICTSRAHHPKRAREELSWWFLQRRSKDKYFFPFPIMQIVILGQRYVEFSGVYLLLQTHYVSNYSTSTRHTHVHRMGEKKGKQKEISEKFLHPIKVAVYVSLPGQLCQNWTNFTRIWHLQVQELWNKTKKISAFYSMGCFLRNTFHVCHVELPSSF